MVTAFKCKCGNTNPKKAKEYEGMLGYEAIICTCCGRYADHNGIHEADEFSLNFLEH